MRSVARQLFILAAIGTLVVGCSTSPPPGGYRVKGRTYVPLTRADGFVEVGLASWYGPGFHGKKTASGETYNMHAHTAAHKLLPLGTVVKVTHVGNGRSVLARINDRGPFVEGRVIDLSYALAQQLGVVGPGTATVKVEAMEGPGGSAPPGQDLEGPFAWQVGAFAVRENSEALARKLARNYGDVTVERFDRGDVLFHRVRLGRYATAQQAHAALASLRAKGLDPILVRRD